MKKKKRDKSFLSWSLHFSRVESNKHVNNKCVYNIYIVYIHTIDIYIKCLMVASTKKKEKSAHMKEGKE